MKKMYKNMLQKKQI